MLQRWCNQCGKQARHAAETNGVSEMLATQNAGYTQTAVGDLTDVRRTSYGRPLNVGTRVTRPKTSSVEESTVASVLSDVLIVVIGYDAVSYTHLRAHETLR